MRRGVGIRCIVIGSTLLTAAVLTVSLVAGINDGVAEALGVSLDPSQIDRLTESLRNILVARGVFVSALAVLLSALLGAAIARALRSAAVTGRRARRGSRSWLADARRMEAALTRARTHRAAERLELERQRSDLELLVSTISEGILQLDEQGRVLRANPAAHRLLALPEDPTGRPLESVVRGADLRRALRRAARQGELSQQDVVFDERTLFVTARPMERPQDGGTATRRESRAGVVVTIADYTPVRRLESVRRDFVANASHELKTPLTAIRGYAETLLGDDLPENVRRQFVQTIFSNADRLQHIVDDLLDLSRLESGRWRPELTDVDVEELAREVWQDFRQRAEDARITFRIEAAARDRVRADPSALHQVLSNLYDNALRYTPKAGHVTTVVSGRPATHDEAREASAPAQESELVSIEVRDTGVGIPGAALPRIFERFYRVDPARSREEGGTGLGLSIVKHLVESMGGRVEAESRLGKGTTIRVYLPAARSEATVV